MDRVLGASSAKRVPTKAHGICAVPYLVMPSLSSLLRHSVTSSSWSKHCRETRVPIGTRGAPFSDAIVASSRHHARRTQQRTDHPSPPSQGIKGAHIYDTTVNPSFFPSPTISAFSLSPLPSSRPRCPPTSIVPRVCHHAHRSIHCLYNHRHADLNRTLGRTQLICCLLPLITRHSGQRSPGSPTLSLQGPVSPKGSRRRPNRP